jgi:hypothetical protein
MKSSLLEKRIAQFCENTTELLIDINARNNSDKKGASNKKRKMQKTISIPDPDIDLLDEEHFGL